MDDHDQATQSNYHSVKTVHYELDLKIELETKLIFGFITHDMLITAEINEIVLDTSYLKINLVKSGDKILKWSLKERNDNLGSALVIYYQAKAGEELKLKIDYSTTSECTAIGWLTKEQTASGLYPFLYSQCQAIHARSLMPCQDTPGIKSTYRATVSSILPVLMSGLRILPPLGEEVPIGDGVYRKYIFEQTVSIPSYLLAIAAGELVFSPLGRRTGVWTEPSKLKAVKWEFEKDTEVYLDTAERLTTPYVWNRYDVLLLPNSFPYGGMENPNITFLTPTLIAGDRSNVDVIAHEISHSWFGNSIGCSSWSSFWLNEGWTTYLERLIVGTLHGSAARDFSYLIGAKALKDSLDKMPRKYRSLHITYEFGDDPDDGFSSIPYDLGGQFLYLLEKTVGIEAFSPYTKAYLLEFTGKSISTQDWLNHFWNYWKPTKHYAALKAIDFDAWIYGDGRSVPNQIQFDTSLADICYALADRWDQARNLPELSFSSRDIATFSSEQISLFLETIENLSKFDERLINEMGDVYKNVLEGGNSEIRVRWYFVALKAGFLSLEAAEWVKNQGRMKYCRPIYQKINKINHSLAVSTFLESKKFYHPIAARLIAKDLGLE